MCFEFVFTASENRVSPAALSTASTRQGWLLQSNFSCEDANNIPGTTKFSSLASSGMTAFGRTNAPVEISGTSGLEGDDGFDVSTTFAKCVGTETFGGEPITS